MAEEDGGKVLTGGAFRPSSTSWELFEDFPDYSVEGGYWMRPVVVDYGLPHNSRVRWSVLFE